MLLTKINKLNLIRNFCNTSIRLSELEPNRNVEQTEIDHFAAYKDEWLNPNGPLQALHYFNPLRIEIVKNGLCSTGIITKNSLKSDEAFKGVKILEVGCGGGILTQALARIKGKIVALDPGEELIKLAQLHLDQCNEPLNIKYSTETVEEHAKENNNIYDAVIVSEVLEHIKIKEPFLEACTKSLKPGGSIFITTFNKTFISNICGVYLAEQVFKLLPVGSHNWDQFISPEECSRILEKYGCTAVYKTGLMYEFWRKRWVLTSSDEINYALHVVKDK